MRYLSTSCNACHSLRAGAPVVRWLLSPLKTCMTFRIRSIVIWAFFALPFQIRQRSRSTCSIMNAFCLHPARFVGRQRTRRQLCVLKPHRDMKPIENRWFRHARSGQDRPKAGTTIGERGQVTVVAHGLEVSANQRRDVGVALRNSAKYLPTSASRLDVADANLQMAFAVVAAADEGGIQTDADRRLRGRRLGQGRVAKLLADFQRMMAKCFRARAGLDRQKMPQHTSGDAIAHQSGKMRLKLIQLWRRPAMRGPTHARLNPATASTKPSREPHRHSTEQSRDLMRSPVLDMAYSIAG